jgi:hypothetical protein
MEWKDVLILIGGVYLLVGLGMVVADLFGFKEFPWGDSLLTIFAGISFSVYGEILDRLDKIKKGK